MNGFSSRGASLKATLRHLREAHATRGYVPPDPLDEDAVRLDDAQRVHAFVAYKRKEEGHTGPYRYDTVASIYTLMKEREDASNGGDENDTQG